MDSQTNHNNACWLNPVIPRLYDWYDECPYDLDMWRTLCGERQSPILDLACGTGRVAIELAREGREVVGLDLSPHMIARANEKLAAEDDLVRERVRFHVADMSAFSLDRRFPMILVPCFSFHELTTLEAQRSCLNAIHRHLADDGTLILTLGFWEPGRDRVPPEEPAEFGTPMEEGLNPHTGLHTRMWSLGWCDPSIQTKYHRFYFEERDNDGSLVRRFAHPEPPLWHARRFLGRYEAEWLLRDTGFIRERIYGHWDMSDLSSQSRCMVVVARKAEQGGEARRPNLG